MPPDFLTLQPVFGLFYVEDICLVVLFFSPQILNPNPMYPLLLFVVYTLLLPPSQNVFSIVNVEYTDSCFHNIYDL